jgi:hypothetical protein
MTYMHKAITGDHNLDYSLAWDLRERMTVFMIDRGASTYERRSMLPRWFWALVLLYMVTITGASFIHA